jgi:ABC-type dipeptide/oligopeptide/nickel transport system permease subunit
MTAISEPVTITARASRPRGRSILFHPKILAGLAILAMFVLLAFAQPILDANLWEGKSNIYDPQFGFDSTVTHPSAPSAAHWLGTSSLGRDVFSMLSHATRPTLLVALSAALAISVVSLVLGSIAAYRGGWVDGFVSHLSDAMVLLPAMIAVFILGIGRPDEQFGALQLGISFGILYGLGPATATVRAAALTVVAHPFMDAARIAIGQEKLAVTPLQMALVASAIANGGTIREPYVVQRVVDRSGDVVIDHEPSDWVQATSAETAAEVESMMTRVVLEGTGTQAALSGLSVAGKTGTAETGDASRNSAWFIGFAPVDGTLVAVAVVIEDTSSTGGAVAAPAAAAVMRAAIEAAG